MTTSHTRGTGAAGATFDLSAPLGPGRLAIEASAGTGKTYTLAALATRYLAESDVTAGELLVVTFTRAATAELRGRIRDRLAQAAIVLAGDGAVPVDDVLLTHLASSDRARRHANLARAVTEFDAATITTIHGFATQALGTLGVTSSGDRDAALVEGAGDALGEICADVLAMAATEGHAVEDLPKLAKLIGWVEVASRSPDLALAPLPSEEEAEAKDHLLRDLVGSATERISAQRRRMSTRSFDDILIDLRTELRGARGQAVREALRQRYRVALIDEFQDTDPVQWGIFSELFGADGVSSLVLVGDPKQAIYSFRGADVGTYVAATASGADRRSLATNYRSDGAVLQALEVLLRGVTFGDDAIGFSPVGVAPGHEDRRILGPDGAALPAVSLRLALADDLERNKRGKPPPIQADDADKAARADLVAQIRTLLDGATIPDRDGRPRPVRPGDIAVLTRSLDEGERIGDLLVKAGVPAVLARGGSVLETAAADQWRILLAAVARPADPRRARAFALGWFGGRTAAWVADAPDDELAEVQDQLHRWSEILASQGIEALLRTIWTDSGVAERVLTRSEGDRAMTDLDHLAELMRTLPSGRRPGVAGLLAVLDREPDPEAKADADREGDVASRRIASEADAVQILTIWVAKGLQFPIVCVPGMFRPPRGRAVIFDDETSGGRTLDLAEGARWPDKKEAKARKLTAEAEALGEDLRLLYVALTRAEHHTILWWSRTTGSTKSALGHLLFARNGAAIDPAALLAPTVELPDDADALDAVAPLVSESSGTIAAAVHGHRPRSESRWRDLRADDEPTGHLVAARLARRVARVTNRWSFTKVAAGAHHPVDGSTPDIDPDRAAMVVGVSGSGAETRGGTDEGQIDPDDQPGALTAPAGARPVGTTTNPSTEGAASPAGSTSPLASLPAGSTFGTLVHAVLEQLDFTAEPLDAAISDELGRQLAWRPFDLTPDGDVGASSAEGRALLVEGLAAVVETPLGPLFGDRRLRDLGPRDRLDEMAFELGLAGGGSPATVGAIGELVMEHLDRDDPYRRWARGLVDGAFEASLAGHLTGSIDLVCRIVEPGAEPRYVVVDYKTTRLHERGCTPQAQDYAARSMTQAMVEHHYPLQALLYSVALHRYLRWRQPGYRPEVHLGGAAYLFVRGMSGPAVLRHDGDPNGVATWAIAPTLVSALSDLLDGAPAS